MRVSSVHIISLLLGYVLLTMNASARAEAVSASVPELPSAGTGWTLQLPEDEKVMYKGVLSYDATGPNGSGMLYPAPNAGGFLAGLITHAIILESMKSRQKTAAQEAADKVLTPFTDVIQNYTHRELMQRAVEKMAPPQTVQLIPYAEKPQNEWLIQSVPVFSLTQDQTALVLDNVISISQPGAASYVNTIRIVSAPSQAPNLVQYWSANQGEKLKSLSVGLVADSLQIAMKGANGSFGGETPTYKTVRYLEGKTEKMERAQLLGEQCNRVLIKTLRGWLMSVPVERTDAGPTLCAGASARLY